MNSSMFSSESSEWRTPPALFAALNRLYDFTLDPCATAENALCKKFFTHKEDGLKQDWSGERVFMNPPYGREIEPWIAKARWSVLGAKQPTIAVALVPARTDTRWWHNYVMNDAAQVMLLMGRVRFVGAPHPAPFPSALILYAPLMTRQTATIVKGWAASDFN